MIPLTNYDFQWGRSGRVTTPKVTLPPPWATSHPPGRPAASARQKGGPARRDKGRRDLGIRKKWRSWRFHGDFLAKNVVECVEWWCSWISLVIYKGVWWIQWSTFHLSSIALWIYLGGFIHLGGTLSMTQPERVDSQTLFISYLQ